MAQVAFERVGKICPDGTRAVNDLSLDIRDAECAEYAEAKVRHNTVIASPGGVRALVGSTINGS